MFRHQRRIDRAPHTDEHDVPTWFTTAVDEKPEHSDVEAEGCRIHLRAWGDPKLPPLILVHGGGAHSGWWDHIAPFFTATHRVVAPDLSGHGDSEHREAYDLDVWSREVLAATQAGAPAGQPIIVGHSMGGWVAATAATHFGRHIDSIVSIDSPLRDRAPEAERLRENKDRHRTGYPTKDEILARFTAVPKQDVILPYVGRHIADESVRQTDGGWVWKFDRGIFSGPLFTDETPDDQEVLEEMMSQMPCRLGYLRCEAGLVPPAMADKIRSILQLRGPFVELAEAGHHPMLDQPLPLVASLRTLLEFWSIT